MVELRQLEWETTAEWKSKNKLDLKTIAHDKGFTISENKGLGNCMFIALSEQLGRAGIEISHEELRQSVVEYLKENPKLVSIVIVFLEIKLGLVTKADAASDAKTERAFRCSLRKSSIKREERLLKCLFSTANDSERKTRMAWTQVTGSSCQVCYRDKKYLNEKNNIKDNVLAVLDFHSGRHQCLKE